MKVMIVSIIIGALGIVTKRLVQWQQDLEIMEQMETPTTALLRSARVGRRALETWGDFLWKPSGNTGVKNS